MNPSCDTGLSGLSLLRVISGGLDSGLGVIMLNLQFGPASFWHLTFENKHFPVLLQTLGKHHFHRCTIFHPLAAPRLFKIPPPPPTRLPHWACRFFFLLVSFSIINKTSLVFLFLSVWAFINIYKRKPSLGRVQNSRVVKAGLGLLGLQGTGLPLAMPSRKGDCLEGPSPGAPP